MTLPSLPPVPSPLATPVPTPDAEARGDRRSQAWIRLQEGNQRFAGGRSEATAARSPQRREELVAGQKPFAAVLSCADSRIPTEILFDQGLGDLFVVRTAGHAIDDAVLGSLEYAVAVLGVDLILVLGHAGCGAIAAAAATVAGTPAPGGYVRDIVERLTCDITQAHHAGLSDLHDLARWHAAASGERLRQRSAIIAEAAFHTQLGVLTATYDLGTGLVSVTPLLEPTATSTTPDSTTPDSTISTSSEPATSSLIDPISRSAYAVTTAP